MNRPGSSFRRAAPRYKAQPRVLIICEDSKSSLIYLKDAARYFRSYAEIEILHSGNTDPMGIVRQCAARKRQYDSVYGVIDRDDHIGFDKAMQLAAQAEVNLIVTYPCYEYWLLLHFRKTRAPCRSVGAQSAGDRMVALLRNERGMEDYAKGEANGVFLKLLERLPLARQRAVEVLADAEVDGEPNPSTRLHELVGLLQQLGDPQSLA